MIDLVVVYFVYDHIICVRFVWLIGNVVTRRINVDFVENSYSFATHPFKKKLSLQVIEHVQYFLLLQNNIFKLVNQGGKFKDNVNIHRGCRQGDPISFYVFIFCVEIIVNQKSNNKNIKVLALPISEIGHIFRTPLEFTLQPHIKILPIDPYFL